MASHDFANGRQGSLRLTATEPTPPRTPALAAFGRSTSGGIVVFSGGSAANSLVDVFNEIREANHNCSLSYVIPISDNGGSSSELIRVFGGPGMICHTETVARSLTSRSGIGDVRSRLVRLIPNDGDEAKATKDFFNYRLPKAYAPARLEWLDIVEGTHGLWTGISSPKKELIRSFLTSINSEAIKRIRPTSRFDYSGASIGNLFLTGYIILLLAGVVSHADPGAELDCSLVASRPQYIWSRASATSQALSRSYRC